MNMFFRNATENEVEILTRMSRESFLSDTAFGGAILKIDKGCLYI